MRSRPYELNRRAFLGAGALLALAAPSIARGAPALAGLAGGAFGTRWSVSLPAGSDAEALRGRIEDLLAGIDRVFSPWRDDSVVGRFNAGSPGVAESGELADVTRTALDIAAASGGRFDPTVGPLVARWGFGPIREGRFRAGGWRDIGVDGRHVLRARDGVTLDLCGIAKGHALDRMAALLEDAGHGDFLVDLGGELAARGRHPSGRHWHAGVENPLAGKTDLAGVIRLDRTAVATSGDRANGYDLGGRRYSHIIDPLTAEPSGSPLASVSVVAATAREADGWATALMAAAADGPALAGAQGIPALFLFREGGGLRRVAAGGIDRYLA